MVQEKEKANGTKYWGERAFLTFQLVRTFFKIKSGKIKLARPLMSPTWGPLDKTAPLFHLAWEPGARGPKLTAARGSVWTVSQQTRVVPCGIRPQWPLQVLCTRANQTLGHNGMSRNTKRSPSITSPLHTQNYTRSTSKSGSCTWLTLMTYGSVPGKTGLEKTALDPLMDHLHEWHPGRQAGMGGGHGGRQEQECHARCEAPPD